MISRESLFDPNTNIRKLCFVCTHSTRYSWKWTPVWIIQYNLCMCFVLMYFSTINVCCWSMLLAIRCVDIKVLPLILSAICKFSNATAKRKLPQGALMTLQDERSTFPAPSSRSIWTHFDYSFRTQLFILLYKITLPCFVDMSHIIFESSYAN